MGETMGLTDYTEHAGARDRPIDRCRFRVVVQDILRVMLDLFEDSQKIKDKYGCRQIEADRAAKSECGGAFATLSTSFTSLPVRQPQGIRSSNLAKTLRWVIHDRKKFGGLVAEIKDLMNSLQGLTSPTGPLQQQATKLSRIITDIKDIETLSMIAEVCSEDHPELADVASTRADTLSFASSIGPKWQLGRRACRKCHRKTPGECPLTLNP